MKKLLFALVFIVSAAVCRAETIYDESGLKVERIDSATFFAAKKRVNPKPQTRRKITDFNEVKKLLVPRGFKFENNSIYYPKTGRFYKQYYDNYNEMSGAHPDPILGLCLGAWYEYSEYYPDDDVMVINSGDDNGYYNFRTGDIGHDVGYPDHWLYSPSGLYRLNECYGGIAAGSDYNYLQKRIATGKYRSTPDYGYSSVLTWKTEGEVNVKESFWQSDTILYLLKTERGYDWSEDENKYLIIEMGDHYYRVTIK